VILETNIYDIDMHSYRLAKQDGGVKM